MSIIYELFTQGKKIKDLIMNLIEKMIKLFMVSLERIKAEFNRFLGGGVGGVGRKEVHRTSGESMKL